MASSIGTGLQVQWDRDSQFFMLQPYAVQFWKQIPSWIYSYNDRQSSLVFCSMERWTKISAASC